MHFLLKSALFLSAPPSENLRKNALGPEANFGDPWPITTPSLQSLFVGYPKTNTWWAPRPGTDPGGAKGQPSPSQVREAPSQDGMTPPSPPTSDSTICCPSGRKFPPWVLQKIQCVSSSYGRRQPKYLREVEPCFHLRIDKFILWFCIFLLWIYVYIYCEFFTCISAVKWILEWFTADLGRKSTFVF